MQITANEVIEEIRESRRRMSKHCQHDPAKLIKYLKTFNRKYATQIERCKKEHLVAEAKPSE